MNAASGSASARAEPVLIEELEVLASGAAVTNLLVSRQPGTPPRLIVVTDDEVRALPLHRCGDKAVRCSDCVRLQDPYCGWEAAGQRCAPVDSPAWPEGVTVVQNVSHGVHPHCPPSEYNPTTTHHPVTPVTQSPVTPTTPSPVTPPPRHPVPRPPTTPHPPRPDHRVCCRCQASCL